MNIKFYLTISGRSPVEEFLKRQLFEIHTAFIEAVDLLASGRMLPMPLSRNLSGIYPGLHELRLKDRAGQVRVLYLIKKGDAIYMLHAFRKKSRELPRREIETAIKRAKEV